MKIPKPDDYGRYKMADGSIIYPSGRDYSRDGIAVKMPDAGKWMLWVKEGDRINESGNPIAFGSFCLTRDSVEYFKTPMFAKEKLEQVRNLS
jgi:hypothetical protein